MAAAKEGRVLFLASSSIENTDVRPTRSGGQIANNRPHPDDAYNLR